jgi:hypothetical protein
MTKRPNQKAQPRAVKGDLVKTPSTPSRLLATKAQLQAQAEQGAAVAGTGKTTTITTKPTHKPTASAVSLVAQFITDRIEGELLLRDPLVFVKDAIVHQGQITFVKYVLRREGVNTPYGFIYLTERQAEGVGTMVALGVR